MMTYSLLAPDYPSLVRYISGAFIVLGLFFVVPIVLLIGFDFVVWVYRICWSRNWQESRNGQLRPPTAARHALETADGLTDASSSSLSSSSSRGLTNTQELAFTSA
ncbi:hypothetical protein CGCVW01_v013724 [Colletotrichum viniferum]|nr:hypothetical protein CGCVW01_v013724 [Colletotrichum viniferum]